MKVGLFQLMALEVHSPRSGGPTGVTSDASAG